MPVIPCGRWRQDCEFNGSLHYIEDNVCLMFFQTKYVANDSLTSIIFLPPLS